MMPRAGVLSTPKGTCPSLHRTEALQTSDSASDFQVYFICLSAKLSALDRTNDSGPNLHCSEPKSFEQIENMSLHH